MKTQNGRFNRRFQVARLVMCLILITITAIPRPAQAAGVYTHTIFVEYAIQRLVEYDRYSELVDLLNRYPTVVNYAAMFPDITYPGIDPDWGERVHDTQPYDVRDNYDNYLKYLKDPRLVFPFADSASQTKWYKMFLDDPNSKAQIPSFRAALMGQLFRKV
jgi:hypothetical protein